MQQTLAMAADENAQYERCRRPTKRDAFLATMEQIVPWSELCSVIEPHYPRPGNGRPPVGLERMLRMYFVQHWFNLADAACEDALLDSTALRRFVGIDLGRERVPDATTLLKFRRLLEKHKLGEALFAKVGEALQAHGLKVGTGTIVDATIIGAPSSTQWCVSRTQAADLWCCTEDGSRPPEAGLQGQASNHPVLLRSKGVVVSDRGKVTP
jgi:IS5 family transposase